MTGENKTKRSQPGAENAQNQPTAGEQANAKPEALSGVTADIIGSKEVKTAPAKEQKQLQAVNRPAVFLALAVFLGAVAAAGATYYWHKIQMNKVRNIISGLENDKKDLNTRLEENNLKLHNVQIGASQMNKLFETIGTPPGKPRYERAGEGIIIYWLDGMLWRRYYLYQAEGKKGELKKLGKRFTQKNFIFIPKLKPGIMRFAVTAVDREGVETKMSEELEIKF